MEPPWVLSLRLRNLWLLSESMFRWMGQTERISTSSPRILDACTQNLTWKNPCVSWVRLLILGWCWLMMLITVLCLRGINFRLCSQHQSFMELSFYLTGLVPSAVLVVTKKWSETILDTSCSSGHQCKIKRMETMYQWTCTAMSSLNNQIYNAKSWSVISSNVNLPIPLNKGPSEFSQWWTLRRWLLPLFHDMGKYDIFNNKIHLTLSCMIWILWWLWKWRQNL